MSRLLLFPTVTSSWRLRRLPTVCSLDYDSTSADDFRMLTDTVTDRDVYFNAEYKSYQAVQDVDAVSGVETYKLVETEESKRYIHTSPKDFNLVD